MPLLAVDRAGPMAGCASMMYGTSTVFGSSAHWDFMDMPYGWGATPSAVAWHHIALVYDGQVEKVYLDGALNNQEQKYRLSRSGTAHVRVAKY